METMTQREAPKIRIWDSSENRFIRPDHQCYMQECGTMLGGQSGRRKDHLHALRTTEINRVKVTEYDVNVQGLTIALWDGDALRACSLNNPSFGFYSGTLRHIHNWALGFNALEHPERLEYTIPREVLDAHPLLAQAVARIDKHAPLRKELAELKQRAQEDAARIERLEEELD